MPAYITKTWHRSLKEYIHCCLFSSTLVLKQVVCIFLYTFSIHLLAKLIFSFFYLSAHLTSFIHMDMKQAT